MFRSRSWFGSGWGRPKNPHSLEHLKYLYNVLARNQTVSEHNRGLLVESLRCIAEILIWGDQNDSSVFDFFLEKNMLSFFLRIMRQRSGGSSYVCVQLLQTLNILFENIRNETSLYYLLSNNHVNSIIVHKFDFSDEEVMAYYISFLKTLSLKLNAHTIHFFYNEHTNDFPLYTEAIKFFNHPESMVRIAVRTLTLNVYRVDDASMLAFIRDRTAAPYFSNIVWFIGKHILELDACVRNDADHQSQNRLADLVAEHLDHLHYINDILSLNITDLNQVLTEHLLHKLLVPLYIYSLRGTPAEDDLRQASDGKEGSQGRVAPVVALFLLSQVFLIITHAPLVKPLAWIILRADGSIFEHRANAVTAFEERTVENDCAIPDTSAVVEDETRTCVATALEQENATDEEKLLVATPTTSMSSSPFFEAVLRALDCSENDYTALFALSLLYALANNKGVPDDLLDGVLRPTADVPNSPTDGSGYNIVLVDRVLQLITLSCQPTCRVRLVTLELGLRLLQQLVGRRRLIDSHRAAVESARALSTALLRNFYKSDEIFPDMFEHEYADMGPTTSSLNVEWLCMDATLLLPPTGTPMTGIAFTKRLPCGEVERARRAIRAYFLVRATCLSLADEKDTQLPLTNPHALVPTETALDLNNSDLLSCTVVRRDGSKIRRFLVIDVVQLILVEPDTKKLGWGVVKLVGFLQDVEVLGDKDDSRSLHITVHSPPVPGATRAPPLLSAKFVFDDHIRCMAAKQRLTKGRLKARQKKMLQIARLLDIPGQIGPPSPAHSNALVATGRTVGGRGARENRSLLPAGRVPGFATPRRDVTPPQLEQKREKTSRDGSSSRQRSRDASPRMPRPRSEEIPLELIRRTQAAGAEPQVSTPKISILPRPQEREPRLSEGDDTAQSSTSADGVVAPPSSEETSFIANQEKKANPRRKGAIETV